MSPPRETGGAEDEVRALLPDIETLANRLAAADYLVDEGLATSMFLSARLPIRRTAASTMARTAAFKPKKRA